MARKSSSPTASQKLLTVLRDEARPHRRQLSELAIDHAFSLPLASIVDVDSTTELVLQAIRAENVELAIRRVVIPGDARLRAHFEQTRERVRDLVPSPLENDAVRIVRSAKRPEGLWLKGAVDPAPIRALFVPIVQEILLNFAKKLPIPGLSGESEAPASKERSGGLFGAALRAGTSTVAGMGKAALGGVTGEIEKRVQAITRDFATQTLTEIRAVIKARILSAEGQKAIQTITDGVLARVLATEVHTILQESKDFPLEDFALLAPALLEHNRKNPHLRTYIQNELRAVIAAFEGDSVGEVLQHFGLRDEVRTRLIEDLQAPMLVFVQSDEFEQWLSDLVKDAEL